MGKTLGGLTVTNVMLGHNNIQTFTCTCECGRTLDISSVKLLKGMKSCGCMGRTKYHYERDLLNGVHRLPIQTTEEKMHEQENYT